MLVDIVIPVAVYHAATADRAIQSAQAQSIPCNVIVVEDTEQRGAGWARNAGVRQGNAPFVVFLDADDVLHEDFVQACASVYQQGTYVYTDWQTPTGYTARLPDSTTGNGWYEHRIFHLVTTLLPRAAFEAVGGFDDSLPGLEDLHLYRKLHSVGICGFRCPQVLATYHTDEGQRSKQIVASGKYASLRNWIVKSIPTGTTMACGCNSVAEFAPLGQKQEGDILALSLWEGNRDVRGVATGRRYRGGWGREVWISPTDLDTEDSITGKKAFGRTIDVASLTPDVESVLSMMRSA